MYTLCMVMVGVALTVISVYHFTVFFSLFLFLVLFILCLVLITLTNNPHVSMPTLVEMLGERLTNSSWVVVMKALITSHNLMTLGNEVYSLSLSLMYYFYCIVGLFCWP